MIMMLVIIVVLVIRSIIPKTYLASESCLGQQLQRSVNRSQTDPRVDLVHKEMQVFAG